MSYTHRVQGPVQVHPQQSIPAKKFSPPSNYLQKTHPKGYPPPTLNNSQTTSPTIPEDQVKKVQVATINGVFTTMSRFFRNEVDRHPHHIVKIKKFRCTKAGAIKMEYSKSEIKARDKFLKNNLLACMKNFNEVVVDSKYVKIHLLDLTSLNQTFGIGTRDLLLSKIDQFGEDQKMVYDYLLKEAAKSINDGKGDCGTLKLIISVIENIGIKTFEASRSVYLKSLCVHASEALVAKGYGKTDEKLWK